MLWAENELINTPRSGMECLIHSWACKKAVLDMVFGTMTYIKPYQHGYSENKKNVPVCLQLISKGTAILCVIYLL